MLKLTLSAIVKSQVDVCSICGSTLPAGTVVGKVDGTGSPHYICSRCILLPIVDMQMECAKFVSYLRAMVHSHEFFLKTLRREGLERPSKSELDQMSFDAQTGDDLE